MTSNQLECMLYETALMIDSIEIVRKSGALTSGEKKTFGAMASKLKKFQEYLCASTGV